MQCLQNEEIPVCAQNTALKILIVLSQMAMKGQYYSWVFTSLSLPLHFLLSLYPYSLSSLRHHRNWSKTWAHMYCISDIHHKAIPNKSENTTFPLCKVMQVIVITFFSLSAGQLRMQSPTFQINFRFDGPEFIDSSSSPSFPQNAGHLRTSNPCVYILTLTNTNQKIRLYESY